MKRVLCLLAAAAAACGDAPGGAPQPLPDGRYGYQARHYVPFLRDTVELSGAVIVGEEPLGEDDVRGGEPRPGKWEVQQLHPRMETVAAEGGEPLVYAFPTYEGTLVHRFSRSGERLLCDGEYTWLAEGGDERREPVSCTLSTDAPTLPLMEEVPLSPTIRPADDNLPAAP